MDKMAYENLIPSKNYVKERFMKYLDDLLEICVNLGTLLESMDMAFEIDNAAGDQLDVLGILVGIDRLLPVIPTTGTRDMNDEEYRAMIKIKIGRNMWDGTNEEAEKLYDQLNFDGTTFKLQDNQDMSVTLHSEGPISERVSEIISLTDNLIVPAGVGKNIIVHDTVTENDAKIYVGIALYGTVEQDIGSDDEMDDPELDDQEYAIDGLNNFLTDGFGNVLVY